MMAVTVYDFETDEEKTFYTYGKKLTSLEPGHIFEMRDSVGQKNVYRLIKIEEV